MGAWQEESPDVPELSRVRWALVGLAWKLLELNGKLRICLVNRSWLMKVLPCNDGLQRVILRRWAVQQNLMLITNHFGCFTNDNLSWLPKWQSGVSAWRTVRRSAIFRQSHRQYCWAMLAIVDYTRQNETDGFLFRAQRYDEAKVSLKWL